MRYRLLIWGIVVVVILAAGIFFVHNVNAAPSGLHGIATDVPSTPSGRYPPTATYPPGTPGGSVCATGCPLTPYPTTHP